MLTLLWLNPLNVFILYTREKKNYVYKFEHNYYQKIARHWDSGCSIMKGNYILILIRSYILMIVGDKCILDWLPGVPHHKDEIQLN